MPRKKNVETDAVETPVETVAVAKEVKVELPSAALPVGSKAHGVYKGQRVDVEVVTVGDEARYRITPDGTDHPSLSAATKAGMLVLNPGLDPKSAMPAIALTKWWSLDELGDGPVPERKRATPKEKNGESTKRAASRRKSMSPNLKRARKQAESPDGKILWYCSACQDGFYVDFGEEPATCPNGHDKNFGNEDLVDIGESPIAEPMTIED